MTSSTTTRGHGPSAAFLLVCLLATGARAQLSFTNVADATNTSATSFGRGSAMVDLDQDGRLDFIAANSAMDNHFYRQRGNGRFQLMNASWGIAPDARETFAVLAADFDNDGDDDVIFVNGGFLATERNQVLRNDLNVTGQFTDVVMTAGDIVQPGDTFGATALDYDRDGRLDVFLSNRTTGCRLYRNVGNLSFVDVSTQAGIVHVGSDYRHCSSGDIDNDGWIDVGVGNYGGTNLLYRNNGDGTFSEIARASGAFASALSFGVVFEDLDNDGWMDVYLPLHQIQPNPPGPSLAFLNNGDLTFRDVNPIAGLAGQADMGHNTGDLDADGYPELFAGTGRPQALLDDALFSIVPNGTGGIVAVDVTPTSGILAEGPTRCHGSAFGDYDRDGDIDIYANNGGPSSRRDTAQVNFLWQNQGNANHWIALDLEGVLSNRTAVGARTAAFTTSGRQVHRYLGVGKGFGNTDSHTQHVGLGSDAALDRIEITWPSGITQTVLPDGVDRTLRVVETGILLTSPPRVGSAIPFRVAGEAGHTAHVLFAFRSQASRLPLFGGVLELAGPAYSIADVTLGNDGQGIAPWTIPAHTGLVGLQTFVQAYVHAPQAILGGVLTNTIAVTFE